MKVWMLALSLIAVLSFSGLAQAKGNHGNGIKGTVVSVAGNTFTLTLAGKNNPDAGKTITVDATGATVTGTLAPGAKVSVVGTQNGDKITATAVTVHKGHKKSPSNT